MNPFRHLVEILGRGIGLLQVFCLHKTTQKVKTRTNVHALNKIRTHYLVVTVIEIEAYFIIFILAMLCDTIIICLSACFENYLCGWTDCRCNIVCNTQLAKVRRTVCGISQHMLVQDGTCWIMSPAESFTSEFDICRKRYLYISRCGIFFVSLWKVWIIR